MTTDTRKRPTGRHTRRWAAVVAAGALTLTGCGAVGSGNSDSSQPTDRAESAAEPTTGSAATEGGNAASADNQQKTPEGTHVARTASMSLTVKDVEQASAKVRSAAGRAGGHVSAEESHTTPETDTEETERSADTTTDAEPRLTTRSWAEITVTGARRRARHDHDEARRGRRRHPFRRDGPGDRRALRVVAASPNASVVAGSGRDHHGVRTQAVRGVSAR